MTSGTMYIITDDRVYNSPQFRNDMSPFFLINGNGLYAIAHLVKVTDVISFDKAIFDFVKECYDDEQLLSIPDISPEETDELLDFSRMNYIDDWVFVKNVSSKRFRITHVDGTLHYIKPGHIRVFEHGNFIDKIMPKLFNEARQRNDIPSADLVHTISWKDID